MNRARVWLRGGPIPPTKGTLRRNAPERRSQERHYRSYACRDRPGTATRTAMPQVRSRCLSERGPWCLPKQDPVAVPRVEQPALCSLVRGRALRRNHSASEWPRAPRDDGSAPPRSRLAAASLGLSTKRVTHEQVCRELQLLIYRPRNAQSSQKHAESSLSCPQLMNHTLAVFLQSLVRTSLLSKGSLGGD